MVKEDYDIEIAKEYTTLQERIADLEKENAELKENNQFLNNLVKEKEQRGLEVQEDLLKENAELKDEWQEQVQKATDEGYARTLQTIQLSKAKQFIRDFLSVAVDYIDKEDKNYSLIEEAEQFLKDSEVEK